MEKDQISGLLASITGTLQNSSAEDKIMVEELQQTLATALLAQSADPDETQQFTYSRAELSQKIDKKELEGIRDIVAGLPADAPDAETHVVMRDSPLRNIQLTGALSKITAGARISKTVGPLKDLSGRDIFIDFINIQKLIPLYVEGSAQPAILFKASFQRKIISFPNTKPEITKNYKVVANSVWVNAALFDPAAPPGHYFGLRVKGGSIVLSDLPVLFGDKLTLNPSIVATVTLSLEQKVAETNANAEDLYGVDAANTKFDLPETFSFSFKGKTKTIESIDPFGCDVYGSRYDFSYANNPTAVYNGLLNCIAIPVKSVQGEFSIVQQSSPFLKMEGKSAIKTSWWTLPTALIDISKPLEADGNGGIVLECAEGLQAELVNSAEIFSLHKPFVILVPGIINITDLESNGSGYRHQLGLWKDDENPYGTAIDISYLKKSTFIYNTLSQGAEALNLLADVNFKIDRPVKVNGEAVAVQSKLSGLMLIATQAKKNIVIYDDNILWDNKLPADKIPVVKPMAFAMHNALFTTTPPNGAVLYGEFDQGFNKIFTGNLFLTFGMFSYLPSLPDPYAANLGMLKGQFGRRVTDNRVERTSVVWLWLVCRVQWKEIETEQYGVTVSFSFAPLTGSLNVTKGGDEQAAAPATPDGSFSVFQSAKAENATYYAAAAPPKQPVTDELKTESFSLLDVSSNANQMGVAFTAGNMENRIFLRQMDVVLNEDNQSGQLIPLQVSGLDVVAAGYNARAFTVPQIAWEPVLNFTAPQGPYTWANATNDPPLGWNYYPNDGFATRIGNSSPLPVVLSPIPMIRYLEKTYRDKKDGKTYALFNLPFGMFGITILNNDSGQAIKPDIENISPEFKNNISGGIQLELTAGSSFRAEDNLFQGFTVQDTNVLDTRGDFQNASTLGASVQEIFSREFSKTSDPTDKSRPGVPLKRIGLSGYGANAFSDWHNKTAAFAETSQATFNIVTGRTSHEVVQVKSVIYPWGIFVVRTITLFRLSNGYVGRVDSGWQAESDGKFYFGVRGGNSPYEIHPGIINGLYNIRNIRENSLSHSEKMTIKHPDVRFNKETNQEEVYNGQPYTDDVILTGVTFDADIAIENVIEGGFPSAGPGSNQLVPSKGVLGFVQLSPRGTPIRPVALKALLQSQNNTIGAPVNCSIRIAGTEQHMKINRVDVNNSADASGNPIFVAAARGSVILPKEGSWSLVTHQVADGTVTPLPESLSVPLIRVGKWDFGQLINSADTENLQRIAHPAEILRAPTSDTVNFGFLQNLTSQKVLYLTPSFLKDRSAVLSKTPPLLADAYRLLNTKGIFPNIGNADTNLGTAIQLLTGKNDQGQVLEAFHKVSGSGGDVLDAGKQVFEILEVKARDEAGKLLEQGYKLIKQKADEALDKVFKFDLPNFNYDLIDTEDFKVYIEYVATSKTVEHPGLFDYDVNSFADDLTEQWKGRMNNLAMVVDLGPFVRLMTIKGNFNSQKGKETNFGGKEVPESNALPTPEIEFSKDLEPVIQILEILAKLSTGDYADAFQKGLKVAMSNSANIWEYKFEAGKDIPLIKFPLGALYESPQTPLKLEASMALGVYFNAALKVTTDPSQLLPTAGAFFAFHGGLQVMCVSVGAGTIYAVGQVDLKLSADTSPLIALAMKFGFGAQIGVGLPVIGNVSILFMVGVEIYVDSSQTVMVTAFLLFRGHAEILGGLVGVTITIEAKGSVIKQAGGPTNCKASVSFGLDISIFLVIDISFHESWEETRQIA